MQSTSRDIICSEADKRLNELMSEYLSIKEKVDKTQKTLAELHPVVRKRVFALRNIQKETLNVDAEFQREVYAVERKFQPKHDAIFSKRTEIVNGNYEPNESECLNLDLKVDAAKIAEGDAPKGIPNFWLTVLKNASTTRTVIREKDEKVLQYLTNIEAYSPPSEELSFQLDFHFKPNPFFKNAKLTKTYFMKCTPDQDLPFHFEGPEIYKAVGCEIEWKASASKNERGECNEVSFTNDSFFEFFNPPQLEDRDALLDEKIELLEADFEIGHYLKERVVPRAVLFFTSEAEGDLSDDDESMSQLIENYNQSHLNNEADDDDDDEDEDDDIALKDCA